MLVVELKINNYRDRSTLCGILCNAGYTVHVDETQTQNTLGRTDCYVVVEETGREQVTENV